MKLRNLLAGMGSILDISPAPRPELPKVELMSDEEAIADAWQKTGDAMRSAINKEIDDD